MAKQPRQIRTEPPGDFQSRFITLRKTHMFAGGNYQLIGAGKNDKGFYDILKSNTGTTEQHSHTDVINAMVGYSQNQQTTVCRNKVI